MASSKETSSPGNVRKAKHAYRYTRWSLWIVVILLASALTYTLWLNHTLRNPETQTKLAEEASQEIITMVSKLITVPEDKPTVATITDVEKLRESNAVFYKDARNGDSLLIYQTQAIIFRSSENKIIAVAPVVVTPSSESNNTTNNDTDNDTSNDTGDETNNTENDVSNEAESF